MLERRRLTRRQLQVLALACEGLTDKEIARALGIRYSTVRTHIEALYRVFAVSTRGALVATWLRHRRSG